MRALAFLTLLTTALSAEVRIERVPEHGVQPQVLTTASGQVHLVYLKGEPGKADVRYVTRKLGGTQWSEPRSINSVPGSAIAMGTIRGAQMALGKDDSLHIVWNGPGAKGVAAPLYYTRSLDAGATFQPQRDVKAETVALDGGASVAASKDGLVFLTWHGADPHTPSGEVNRRLYLLRSDDNGASFGQHQVTNEAAPGVCACCSLKSFIAPSGELMTLYRAARKPDQRDVTLAVSKDGGATFTHRVVGPWAIAACPMSSMAFASQGSTLYGAWEAEGKVYAAKLDAQSAAIEVGNKGRHPAIAINPRGETLVTWSIGTGWQKGGDLAWTVLDAKGQRTERHGREKGVPVWDFSVVFAEGDDFVILF
jgi:hypothetical protein